MKSAIFALGISVMAAAVAPEGFAQTPTTNSPTAPVTGMRPDRTTAPPDVRQAMQKREAAKRQKRAQCRAKARAEKVPLLKRPAFVKRCMSR